jgi:hypothetical protein
MDREVVIADCDHTTTSGGLRTSTRKPSICAPFVESVVQGMKPVPAM